jgi:hypothetical protein
MIFIFYFFILVGNSCQNDLPEDKGTNGSSPANLLICSLASFFSYAFQSFSVTNS